jgi:hypothetical protein
MTTGVLIFAYNNEEIDYLAMANWSAKNIRRHLNLPVAVVTNITDIPKEYYFEQVIYNEPTDTHTRKFYDLDKSVTWYNGNRVNAYTLSPWSRTLLLDADYVVASDQLKSLLGITQNFLCHQTAYDVANIYTDKDINTFGRHYMPMLWATVILFTRSIEASMIFEMMTMIKQNWQHYRGLYSINEHIYRNDFALAIAANTINGHTLKWKTIPWSLVSVAHQHELKQLDVDQYRVEFNTQDNKRKYIMLNHDFHAMGKGQLGEIIASNS